MNRERDSVGVDPLMHPPVTLTLILFFVKLLRRLHIGSAWALIKDYRAQVETNWKKKGFKKKCISCQGCPTPDAYSWHANAMLIVTQTDQ